MINEKYVMGFTEYLNACYLRKFGNKELKDFYNGQASALEKALEIEDNSFIKNLVGWINSPRDFNRQLHCNEDENLYNGRDNDFIVYIFSERMRILKYLDKDRLILTIPSLGVDRKKLENFLELHNDSAKNLLKEIEFCDKYVWDKLTKGKQWVNFNLDELRDCGYPDRNEIDVLAENF